MRPRICPNCQVVLMPDEYACHVCGTVYTEPQDETKKKQKGIEQIDQGNIENAKIYEEDIGITIKCPYCGAEMLKNSTKCPKCDAPLFRGEAIELEEPNKTVCVEKIVKKEEDISNQKNKEESNTSGYYISGVISFLIGIVGLLIWRTIQISIPVHILVFILSGIGLKNRKKGFAIAGLVLGVLGCVNDCIVLLGLSFLNILTNL